MTLVWFLPRYLGVAIISGFSGYAGTICLIVLIGGIREPSHWDMLAVVQIGGLPSAALAFLFTCRVLLNSRASWWVVAGLLALFEAILPEFFRFVINSDLTGDQGQLLVVAVLVLLGGLVAAKSPPWQELSDEKQRGFRDADAGFDGQPK